MTGNSAHEPGASRVQGRTASGKRCELTDCSGDSLSREELERLLAELIAADAFGFRATGGADSVTLDPPRVAHVQLGGKLYCLIVRRYAARLQPF